MNPVKVIFGLVERQEGEAEDSGLKAENSGLEAEDSGLEAEDSDLEAEDSGLEAEDSGLEGEDSGLVAEDSGPEAENSRLEDETSKGESFWSKTFNVQTRAEVYVQLKRRMIQVLCTESGGWYLETEEVALIINRLLWKRMFVGGCTAASMHGMAIKKAKVSGENGCRRTSI